MKKITALLICIVFALAPLTAFASAYVGQPRQELEVAAKTLNLTHRGISVTGTLPTTNSAAINQEIGIIEALQKAEGERLNASALGFSYEVIFSSAQNICTILIASSFTSPTSDHNISTVVVDLDRMERLGLTDVLGGNALKLCDSVVTNFLNTRYDSLSRHTGLTDNADFYVEDDQVVLVFDKYEIAPGSEGIIHVPVAYGNIKTMTLDRTDYRINATKYSVYMVPLRALCQHFGYDDIRWNSSDQSITIRKKTASPRDEITVRIGVNAYKRSGLSEQPLEAAPEIIDDITYVPITFMETMLEVYYSRNANGSILFSAYEF